MACTGALDAAWPRCPRGRAAAFYLQSQVDAAHGCPITMTSAVVPALQQQPELAAQYLPKIVARQYDLQYPAGAQDHHRGHGDDRKARAARTCAPTTLVPIPWVQAVPASPTSWSGTNTLSRRPCATPSGASPGAGWTVVLWLPRWRADGTKNPMQIQRLKNKMGNVANASCETELRGAWAQMIGPEGRGVATILNMVAMTRFDCMIGSSGGMRQAVSTNPAPLPTAMPLANAWPSSR